MPFFRLFVSFKSSARFLFGLFAALAVFMSCTVYAQACTDNDGDRHIIENRPDFASCGNVCGEDNDEACLGYNDCDDTDPAIYYGAPDICGNGLDEDCQNGPDDAACVCSDLSSKNTCGSNSPWKCNSLGVLEENCLECGCSGGWICGPAGTYCLPPMPVCGNGICESENGESCSFCALDCGRCPTNLTPGTHAITVIAMDSRGNTARRTITLNVDALPLPTPPTPPPTCTGSGNQCCSACLSGPRTGLNFTCPTSQVCCAVCSSPGPSPDSPYDGNGTAYYVDFASGNDSNTGRSPQEAWRTLNKVNNYSDFDPGDDLFFKSGTRIILTSGANTEKLTVSWEGTSDNQAVIGCYWMDGSSPNYECLANGQPRPVFDGNYADPSLIRSYYQTIYPGEAGPDVPDSTYEGVIHFVRSGSGTHGYLTIRELEIDGSGGCGIRVIGGGHSDSRTPGIIIENNKVGKISYHAGIICGSCQGAIIRRNEVYGTRLRTGWHAGGSIMTVGWPAQNNLIEHNVLYHCKECIGADYLVSRTGPKNPNTIVQYNIIYDAAAVAIYGGDGTSGNTIRYNIVYETADSPTRNWVGINFENENLREYCGFDARWPIKVYGNLVAGLSEGIGINVTCSYCYQTDSTCFSQLNAKVFNNTLVDNQNNIQFGHTSGGGYTASIECKNNISQTISVGSNHIRGNEYSAAGVVWGYNLFDDPVSGNAASNAVIGDPRLTRTSGWRTIPPGSVNSEWWRPLSGSPAINAGAALGAPYNTSYNGASRPQGSGWDIGAFEN